MIKYVLFLAVLLASQVGMADDFDAFVTCRSVEGTQVYKGQFRVKKVNYSDANLYVQGIKVTSSEGLIVHKDLLKKLFPVDDDRMHAEIHRDMDSCNFPEVKVNGLVYEESEMLCAAGSAIFRGKMDESLFKIRMYDNPKCQLILDSVAWRDLLSHLTNGVSND